MSTFDTHIVFVSGQAIPNVTPLLDADIRPKKVILCASDAMVAKADLLGAFLAAKGLQHETFPLGNAYDINGLAERLFELAGTLEARKEPIAVNLTGGTKLMTIAAQMVFEKQFPCFYVVAGEDRILWLDRDRKPHAIQNRIRLEDFFAIHGYSVDSIQRPAPASDADRTLFQSILDNHTRYAPLLPALNYKASKAEKEKRLHVGGQLRDEELPIFELFNTHGAIAEFDDIHVRFSGPAGRAFCRGIWLEHFVLDSLRSLSGPIPLQDIAHGVAIRAPGGTPNEIDVACLHRNDLFLVECKTAKMDKNAGTQALYKLRAIRNEAGLRTRCAIVSFSPFTDYDRQRAKDLGIKLIEGKALRNLDKHLRAFIGLDKGDNP